MSAARPRPVLLVALLLAWLLAGAYVFHGLDRTWVPHDEGVLAQGAERVLSGEVPHRDFAAVYTGGLDYLYALGFRLFGVRLMSLRYVLFVAMVAWIPAVYYCAARFVRPLGAAVVTLLAVLWTVPNYPAAMPSWWNLFLATFGAGVLLRFTETGRRGWVVVAGLMGGCSILAKIVGLYYVAACLLFLVAHESVSRPPVRGKPARGYHRLVGLGLVAFAVMLVLLLRRHLTVASIYHFLAPGAGLAWLTWRVVARSDPAPALERLARLGRLLGPFFLGLAIPISIFLIPVLRSGGFDALLRGVFLSPTTRLEATSVSPLGWPAVVPAVLLAGVLVYAVRAGSGMGAWTMAGLWALLLVAAAVGGADYLYRISWASVSQAIPLVVGGGLVVLDRTQSSSGTPGWQQSFLLLAVAGLASFIEYPFAAPIYFCYTAPLALLALISVLRVVGGPPRPLADVLVAYYAGFALVALRPQSLGELGLTAARSRPLERLALPRAGLLVPAGEAAEYRAVVDTLTAHARGRYTYAGPDAPEIYFLAGLRNPTRTFFDFLEPADHAPERVLAAVARHGVTAVVINRFVKFSAPLSPELEAGFAARFPHATTVGRFTVRWR